MGEQEELGGDNGGVTPLQMQSTRRHMKLQDKLQLNMYGILMRNESSNAEHDNSINVEGGTGDDDIASEEESQNAEHDNSAKVHANHEHDD